MKNQEQPCPGCGCRPGDGITESCNHPDGCGFWKQAKKEAGANDVRVVDEQQS